MIAKIKGRTAIAPGSCSSQTKTASNTICNDNDCGNGSSNSSSNKRTFLFEGNVAGDSSNITNSLCSNSSDHSSRKRMKTSDRMSPLSLPRNQNNNNVNANSCNNSVISSSNSSINTNSSSNCDTSNQAMNGNNVPFAANTWWKKGNDYRELMSTSINSNENSVAGSNTELGASPPPSPPFPPTLATNNVESRTIEFSTLKGASEPVLLSGTPGDQTSASWLKLLGEVASFGGNHNRGILKHPQHHMLQQQQQLQALRMQENDRTTTSTNNNPFLASASPNRFPTPLNNNAISRMTIQSRLPGNILDPSMFQSDGMNMPQLHLQQQQQQQKQQLLQQQQLQQQLQQQQLQHQQLQQQQEQLQQQQQQQYQLQQQSLYPFAFPQTNMPLHSAQNSFLQQRQNFAQRQQMQRPKAARAEMKLDAIRTSGDIGEASPTAMERELEESYQQDASFDEEGGSGRGVNEAQKTNNNEGNKRKHNIEIVDVNDRVFSDIVPMIPTSGSHSLKVEGFDIDCANVNGEGVHVDIDVDGMVVSGSNMNQSKSRHYSPMLDPRLDPRAKEVKFRSYQAENWTEKFDDLLRFREENGHCLVPNCHPENPALAQWTKRQRYQYKLKQDGKRSTITDERVRALEEAGFVWDSHKAVWSERLEELKDFKKQYNHCNVPSRYKPNHQLAIWVKRQRRQWKNKLDHLPNCMTDDRQQALEIIGFLWDMKKGNNHPSRPSKQRVVNK